MEEELSYDPNGFFLGNDEDNNSNNRDKYDSSHFTDTQRAVSYEDEESQHDLSNHNNNKPTTSRNFPDDSEDNNNSEELFANMLFNLDSTRRDDRNNNDKNVPRGCFSKLFTGTCPAGDKCKFSHDWKELQKTHAHYTKQLENSRYKSPPMDVKGVLRKPPGEN
jgi:hypothetical protein